MLDSPPRRLKIADFALKTPPKPENWHVFSVFVLKTLSLHNEKMTGVTKNCTLSFLSLSLRDEGSHDRDSELICRPLGTQEQKLSDNGLIYIFFLHIDPLSYDIRGLTWIPWCKYSRLVLPLRPSFRNHWLWPCHPAVQFSETLIFRKYVEVACKYGRIGIMIYLLWNLCYKNGQKYALFKSPRLFQ